MKNLAIGILNELYGSLLTEKQHDMLRSYYDFDLSVSEIAEEYGITRQAAFDALRKGERALLDCEARLGFMAKLNEIKANISDIVAELNAGNAENAKSLAVIALKKL